ncbi:amidase [Micromonospora sp. WMMD1082]|uniref:amidase n=1 Tax=Micromonospora sp. WMMD1082 TaxID=3016104 RepID=UPI0024174052|nr:amidase [Micromonospora sp. WMMD1082]MDG4794550.1 amidase [Micromonospora sp. WMMD1082]
MPNTTKESTSIASRVAEATRRSDRLNPLIGSVLRPLADRDAEAARLDRASADGEPRGPLHGMLLGVKDVIATADGPTTGQSRVHDPDWWAGRDAPVVRRLRAAGAIVVGKTTLAEHALSRPEPDDGFPVPRNPWDLDRWTGGSSSGSANGVAAGLFDAGIGTDCNGSIRIPAAMCGVTGLKPTYGLVSTRGCHPLSRSTDTVGPQARDVRDCAALLAVLAGRDAGPRWRDDLTGVRIGVPADLLDLAGLSDGCRAAFDASLDRLRACGATVVGVAVPVPDAFALFAAQILTVVVEAFEVHGSALRDRWDSYGRPFRRTAVLGGLIRGETYVRAQRVRQQGAHRLADHLTEVDAIATPTWPTVAPRFDDPEGMQQVSPLPTIWSAVGFPAVALPNGVDAAGLPYSLQLAGAPGNDFGLAAIADVYQRSTSWHLRGPADPVRPVDGPAAPRPPGGADAMIDEGLGRALRDLGVPVTDDECGQLAGTWARMGALVQLLPEVPADVAPLASAPR